MAERLPDEVVYDKEYIMDDTLPKGFEEALERIKEERERVKNIPHYHLCDRKYMNGFSRTDLRVPVKVCGGCPACRKYLAENDWTTPLKDMEVKHNVRTGKYFFTNKKGFDMPLVPSSLERIKRAKGVKVLKMIKVK